MAMTLGTRLTEPVAIDTSALSNALDANASVDLFSEAIIRRNAMLMVSEVVLFEFSSNPNVPSVYSHIRRLQRLCRALGRRFCPSLGNADLMVAEAEKWQRGPPVYRQGWENFAAARGSQLRKMASALPESAAWLTHRKTELFNIDRGLSQKVAARGYVVDRDAFVEAICSNEPPGVDSRVIEEAAALSQGRFTAAGIVAAPARFKATHLLAHFDWRQCLANAVERPGVNPEYSLTSAERAQEDVLGVWRTKKKGRGEGAWYDAYIAAAAAYAHVFVTDDDEQRRRCEFLRRRKLLTFRTMSLAEFLSG